MSLAKAADVSHGTVLPAGSGLVVQIEPNQKIILFGAIRTENDPSLFGCNTYPSIHPSDSHKRIVSKPPSMCRSVTSAKIRQSVTNAKGIPPQIDVVPGHRPAKFIGLNSKVLPRRYSRMKRQPALRSSDAPSHCVDSCEGAAHSKGFKKALVKGKEVDGVGMRKHSTPDIRIQDIESSSAAHKTLARRTHSSGTEVGLTLHHAPGTCLAHRREASCWRVCTCEAVQLPFVSFNEAWKIMSLRYKAAHFPAQAPPHDTEGQGLALPSSALQSRALRAGSPRQARRPRATPHAPPAGAKAAAQTTPPRTRGHSPPAGSPAALLVPAQVAAPLRTPKAPRAVEGQAWRTPHGSAPPRRESIRLPAHCCESAGRRIPKLLCSHGVAHARSGTKARERVY
jgi:hypothetical protein